MNILGNAQTKEDPMRRIFGVAAALATMLLVTAPARAQADMPATSDGQQQFKQITDEFDQKMKDFSAEYRKATTDEERQKLYDAKYPKPNEYAKRLMPLAQADPKSPLARDVDVWVVSHNVQGDPGNEALTNLAENFAGDKIVSQQVVPMLQWSDSPQAEKLLRAAVEQNSDRQQKGTAQLTLGTYLKNNNRGPEAEKLLDDVARNYADVKLGRSSLADQANGVLFEIRNLAIGKTAPEITGESIDGKPMKISDFRGKVVVLDFFGDW
jgi:hypothetical protein